MRMPLQRHEVGRPVHQEDPLEYLTTQYLAQGLKRGRLDGVKFRSAVTPEGINLALFDTTAVGFKNVSLYDVKQVRFETSLVDVRVHNPTLMEQLLGVNPAPQ